MGRRGPPPTPTRLKLLAGNPGKRRLNTREPQPRQTTPRCPPWLDKEAKLVWKRITPGLRRMGVLTAVDGEALATFCTTFVRWREAEDFLSKHGTVYPLRDEKGNVRCMQQFPQVAIARNMLQAVIRFYAEFGMTPASRSRIEIPLPMPDRKHSRVFNQFGEPI